MTPNIIKSICRGLLAANRFGTPVIRSSSHIALTNKSSGVLSKMRNVVEGKNKPEWRHHVKWKSKLREAFRSHYKKARHRRIKFLLTFDEWLKIWSDSGHLHERGCLKGQYVMSRPKDRGAYRIGNIRIITVAENLQEGHYGKSKSPECRAKIGASKLGKKRKPFSKAWRRNISMGQRRRRQREAQHGTI